MYFLTLIGTSLRDYKRLLSLFNILSLLRGQEATGSCFLLTGGIDDADPDAEPDPEFILCGCGSGSDFSPLCGSDPDHNFQKRLKPLKSAQIGYIPYILACHLN